MISRVEVFLRMLRRFLSRSEWAIRLLRLSRLRNPTSQPGLVMVQIDGLSLLQFNRALHKGHVPFLNSLLQKQHYTTHAFYSGLPSNTPSVQGEIFYGVKSCVPAFSFVDRKLGKAIRMFDAPYVEQFEPRLKEQGKGLLEGGSAYCDIFTGGAKEAHFCWAKIDWQGIWHAANPLMLPFVVILYVDIFLRTFLLLIIEIILSIFDCTRGILQGRVLFKEIEYIWLRALVCVFLREFIVAGVCMDIIRGLPVIHMNFLGYDEQAHCRGPSSAFAHWTLKGIDDAIKRIHHVIGQSPYREYDLWVYSDHGQEKTTPYQVAYGQTIETAVKKLFETVPVSVGVTSHSEQREGYFNKSKKAKVQSESVDHPQVIVTAMGPLGHIYTHTPMLETELASYAQKLVHDLHIPLVITTKGSSQLNAWTKKGCFVLPEQVAEVFGADHPFLDEIKEDIFRVCHHPDAGEFIIAGWAKDTDSISFPVEYGSHAGMGSEETKSFALLPLDAPVKSQKAYLRPLDLREAAMRFLNEQSFTLSRLEEAMLPKPLRLMSYNVHGCQGMDGGISTDRIARVIARHQPDVVCLQELDVGRSRSGGIDQAERIARKLEMQYHFHPVHRWKDEQYGNAILSKYPLGLIKMEALPISTVGKSEPRGAVWVAMEFQGIKIQIVNTHLSIWPKERLLQVNALLSKDWLNHPDCKDPLIVCGDFNSLPSSLVYKRMSQRLKDTQALLSGHKPHRTWFGRYPLSQIDYVFVSPEFQVQSIIVPRTNLDQLASDHLPLIVDLNFYEHAVLSMSNISLNSKS